MTRSSNSGSTVSPQGRARRLDQLLVIGTAFVFAVCAAPIACGGATDNPNDESGGTGGLSSQTAGKGSGAHTDGNGVAIDGGPRPDGSAQVDGAGPGGDGRGIPEDCISVPCDGDTSDGSSDGWSDGSTDGWSDGSSDGWSDGSDHVDGSSDGWSSDGAAQGSAALE